MGVSLFGSQVSCLLFTPGNCNAFVSSKVVLHEVHAESNERSTCLPTIEQQKRMSKQANKQK